MLRKSFFVLLSILALIAFIPTLVLLILDAYYLSLERVFRQSYDNFVEKLHKGVVKENDIYSSGKNYSSVSISILDDNGFIKGFTYGLIGMKNNSNSTIIVLPEYGYGELDEEEIFEMPRHYSFELIEERPKEELTKNYTIGETFKEQAWNVTVVNITNDTVIFEHSPKINTTFIFMGIPNEIYDINETHAIVEAQLEEGSLHLFEHPKTHQLTKGRVTVANETTIIIDFNHRLAGKTLYFDVWIRDIEKRQ